RLARTLEKLTKIQEIIKHVLPIQKTEQELILNELGLNLNIIDEFKTIVLTNQIIRIIETIYFTLTKKQIDKNDLKKRIKDIDIEFVRVRRAFPLRGFSGRKKIYVNADHFLLQYKYDNPSPPLELLQLDLLTLLFHESMHTISRDIENNYNLSKPIDYTDANAKESGACIETCIFSCSPNWIEIYKNNIISVREINSILNAFKADQPVSLLIPQGLNCFVRNVSTMALDITSIDFGKSWEV
ncbi:unnamed protein product, partial [Rotaria socialis]